ncbi:MAG TPA: beta-L-arabinofuranosidase domain-containing protein [Bryobacteraceae bacterium]|nr:beta-L-arabinofuranosidase domain-containing protein [Bryobacteraceae bacterium]
MLPGLGAMAAAKAATSPDYPASAVPFSQVEIRDDFWSPRMEANRTVSIWHCLDRMQDRGDFGISKLIEGAAYMLAKRPDPKLETAIRSRIDRVTAQVTLRLGDPDRAVRVSGHFLEAAASWYRLTGERKMLDPALQDFEAIAAAFGPGKRVYISEHEGQKIGLVALYRVTGDPRHWQLARFFLDQRGRDDYPRRGEYAADRTYAQDHLPVMRQTEAVGHCVRAMFLYIALADIAALTGAPEYHRALHALWSDVVFRKMYVTGAIGSIRFHEQFGAAYELPNLSAWNETCAAYGNVLLNHRMFLLYRDAQYLDVMERVLYNGFLDGVSLKGDRFFYQNPLKSFGNYQRFEWINTPCCPPNVVRLIASLPGYIYAQSPGTVYVNLFIGSRARLTVEGASIMLAQETRYPWDGRVRIQVDPGRPTNFALAVRIPAWTRGQAVPGDLYRFTESFADAPTLAVNGRRLPVAPEQGFAMIRRTWKKGDVVELDLPMPVRRVIAHQAVKENNEHVALQRGPLVYCAEWPDNSGHALNLVLPPETVLQGRFDREILGGIGVVESVARSKVVAVPYFAWSNRGMGEMQVWMPRTSRGAWTRPVPPAPIARVLASGQLTKENTGYNDQNDDLCAVYDGIDPLNSADESSLYFRMRPPAGSPACIEYEFNAPAQLSSSRVYWYDDRRFCHLPASWRILYRDTGEWKPVVNRAPYAVTKDRFDTVTFESIRTDAVRLEIVPQSIQYRAGQIGPPDAMFVSRDIEWREAGVLEWRIS